MAAPDSRRSRAAALATIATSLLAVAAVAGVFLLIRPASSPAPAESQPEGTALLEGRDYRVLVAVARVKPRTPEGGAWDAGSSSTEAPDPFYDIAWRDNLVYVSPVVSDVLVASWSDVALPKILKLVAGERVSLESIKQGALVTARASDTIRIRVWDDDPIRNDLIEEMVLSVGRLRVGDQEIPGKQGLESLTLRVIPGDTQQLSRLLR